MWELIGVSVEYEGPGFRWENVNDPSLNIAEVYIMLAVEWIIIMIAWAYLEQVVPTQWGVSKQPLFFLGFSREKKIRPYDAKKTHSNNEPRDVADEHDRAMHADVRHFGIVAQELGKTFPPVDKNPPKVAVKEVSFAVEKRGCVGILGHNGAGKVITSQPFQLVHSFIANYSIHR
jgi:ABC-type multidrug transport system fused ATPase/permease subunit